MDSNSEINLDSISESDRREIQQFIQHTNNQTSVNEMVNTIVKSCFKKCVQNPIKQGELSTSEQSCASNCVARWFDSQTAVVKAVSNQKGGSF